MYCKICSTPATYFSSAVIMNKYNIEYYRCPACGFVQTETPYWLQESYQGIFSQADQGLIKRNYYTSFVTKHLIMFFSNADESSRFLDFGGGYGIFVRLMRDAGLNFHWYDPYCPNMFAQGYEVVLSPQKQYNLITAFEVFEHFVNPLLEIGALLQYSKNIFFSTELLPDCCPKPNEWWYYALDSGQHTSIYTKEALQVIARNFGLNFYTNNHQLHLLSEKMISQSVFLALCQPF